MWWLVAFLILVVLWHWVKGRNCNECNAVEVFFTAENGEEIMDVFLKESGDDRVQTFKANLRKSPESGGGLDESYQNPEFAFEAGEGDTAPDGSCRILSTDGLLVTLEYLAPSPVEVVDGHAVRIPTVLTFLVDSDDTEGEQLIGGALRIVSIPDNATSVEFERVANPVQAQGDDPPVADPVPVEQPADVPPAADPEPTAESEGGLSDAIVAQPPAEDENK